MTFFSGLSRVAVVDVHQSRYRVCRNLVVVSFFVYNCSYSVRNRTLFLFRFCFRFILTSVVFFLFVGEKQATFFSGLSPVAAVDVHQSLDKACQNLVVSTELHALYLLTPLEGIEPHWGRFREEYTAWREDDPSRVVGKAVSLLGVRCYACCDWGTLFIVYDSY